MSEAVMGFLLGASVSPIAFTIGYFFSRLRANREDTQ